MRLSQRLLLFCVVLISAPAMISFAAFYLMSRSAVPAMRASVEQRAQLELERLVQASIAPLADDDAVQLRRLLDELARDPGLVWAVVTDENGRAQASYGAPPARPVKGAPRIAVEAETAVGWAVVEVEGLTLGRVGIGYSMTAAEQVGDWTSILGTATVLISLGGIGFSILFARRFVRPIEEMKQFTAAVTAGDLSRRIASDDASELGELAHHLDSMTTALEARDRELTSQRARLERALGEVRATQDELMRSSRLAAVGEMAGRTAHEVLNPAQSLHARLTRMASEYLSTARHNADVLAAIVEAWQQAGASGPDGLVRALSEQVGDATVLDADLRALDELAAWYREVCDHADGDFAFLHRELARITRIVDGMRSMSRQRSSLSRHALAPLLVESCEIVRDACAKRSIAIGSQCAADLEVESDRYELLQVLTNLLRNAMFAIEQRHGRAGGSIVIEAAQDAAGVTILVTDNGTGIAAENLPLIFEPCFTTREAAEGTGLGLSISRRLVRQIGGDLDVATTTVDVGTTFRITLPVATPHASLELPSEHPRAA